MKPRYDQDGIVFYNADAVPVMAAQASESVDAIVTDLPYGMDLVPQRAKTKAIANDGRREAKALWWALMPHLHRVAKPNTAHLFFSRWSETWSREVLAEFFTVKGCVVWKKNVWGLGYYLRPQWELAWYCHKGEPPVPEKAQSDVWECDRIQEPDHSCEKPVALMQRAISFVAPQGGRICDPCLGLGATAVAAKLQGCSFIGAEIDSGYCETAANRLSQGVLFGIGGAA